MFTDAKTAGIGGVVFARKVTRSTTVWWQCHRDGVTMTLSRQCHHDSVFDNVIAPNKRRRVSRWHRSHYRGTETVVDRRVVWHRLKVPRSATSIALSKTACLSQLRCVRQSYWQELRLWGSNLTCYFRQPSLFF